jgi:hypothetical protein
MINATNELSNQRMLTSRSAQNVQRANVVVFDRPLGSLSWLRDAVPMRRIVRTGGRLRVLPYIEALGIRFSCHEFPTTTQYNWRPVLVFLHPEDVRMAYALAAIQDNTLAFCNWLIGARAENFHWRNGRKRLRRAESTLSDNRSSLVTDDLRLAQ